VTIKKEDLELIVSRGGGRAGAGGSPAPGVPSRCCGPRDAVPRPRCGRSPADDGDGDLAGSRRAQPAGAHGERGGGAGRAHQLSTGHGDGRGRAPPPPIKALVGLGCAVVCAACPAVPMLPAPCTSQPGWEAAAGQGSACCARRHRAAAGQARGAQAVAPTRLVPACRWWAPHQPLLPHPEPEARARSGRSRARQVQGRAQLKPPQPPLCLARAVRSLAAPLGPRRPLLSHHRAQDGPVHRQHGRSV